MIFESPTALLGKEGCDLGVTPWLAIEQPRIDLFAEATEDRQWIHCDVERAKAGPFGGPIAHGYLTSSLFAYFLPQLLEIEKLGMGVNVGMDRLRFIAPVRAGSRIRARGEIIRIEEMKGAFQATTRVTIEIEGGDKPACIGDVVGRYFPE